jgi:peptidoglycan/xylan/chitin deacetylase (PgdA/CDA1 family)
MRATVFPIVGCTQVTVAWDVYAPKKHLSKEQLKIISNAGHEIGSHTMTHPDCVLLSAEKLRDELIDSKKILEDIIQKPVQSISFPSGSWNARVWDCARECGYITGVVYRKHSRTLDSMIPAIGVYAFDSVEDIIEKVGKKKQYSHACARSIIMPHFAKGTSVWKYRSEYRILNIFS